MSQSQALQAEPNPSPQPSRQPLHIVGMHGMGDCIHARAILRQKLQSHEVWLESSWVCIYHDLIADGLHVIHKQTPLRTQTLNARREADKFDRTRPPNNARHLKIWYRPEQVRSQGNVLKALCLATGCDYQTADFRLPVPMQWRDQFREQLVFQKWRQDGRPLMVYRPPSVRPEWGGAAARNPDAGAYFELFKAIRDKFFVVSVAHFERGKEWIGGIEADADAKFHHGELPFEQLAGLFSMASLVFTTGGFPVILAQAVHTPVIAIMGGYEDHRSYLGGARYSPYLGIDPIKPCQCFSHHHACQKAIDIPAAQERIAEFLKQFGL